MPGTHWACIIGGPAAAKGVHAKLLGAAFPADVVPLVVPDLLRASPQAAAAMASGALVPDALVDAVVDTALSTVGEGQLALLAGYPASAAQAQRLARREGLARFALSLDIPEDVARERMLQTGMSATADARLAAFKQHAAAVPAALTGLVRVDGKGTESQIHAAVRAAALAPSPLPRELVPSTGGQSSGADNGVRLKILQWNVLADGLSGNTSIKGGFTLCPTLWLDWAVRFERLAAAVADAVADIVVLQEVDHADQWKETMLALGYDCEVRLDLCSPCLKAALNEPKLPDGVAVFWKRDVLSLDEAVLGEDVSADGIEYKSKLLLARLQHTASGAYVVVVNCHLDSQKSEEGVKVRAVQSRRMLEQAKAFADLEAGKPCEAWFVCGDLNATRGEECHDAILEAGLADCYAEAGFGDMFTSIKVRTGSFKAGSVKYAVDHMFHSSGAVPTGVMSLPQEDLIGACGLPSVNYPSDHLSLYGEFLLEGITSTTNPLADGQGASFDADDAKAAKRTRCCF